MAVSAPRTTHLPSPIPPRSPLATVSVLSSTEDDAEVLVRPIQVNPLLDPPEAPYSLPQMAARRISNLALGTLPLPLPTEPLTLLPAPPSFDRSLRTQRDRYSAIPANLPPMPARLSVLPSIRPTTPRQETDALEVASLPPSPHSSMSSPLASSSASDERAGAATALPPLPPSPTSSESSQEEAFEPNITQRLEQARSRLSALETEIHALEEQEQAIRRRLRALPNNSTTDRAILLGQLAQLVNQAIPAKTREKVMQEIFIESLEDRIPAASPSAANIIAPSVEQLQLRRQLEAIEDRLVRSHTLLFRVQAEATRLIAQVSTATADVETARRNDPRSLETREGILRRLQSRLAATNQSIARISSAIARLDAEKARLEALLGA